MTAPTVLDPADLVDDLRVVLNLDDIDEVRATVLLDLAVQRVSSVISPVPAAARPIVLDVTARAYANPSGVTQESVGPFTRSFTSPGLYLSKRERADLRRMRGSGGAFTINPTGPSVVTVVVDEAKPLISVREFDVPASFAGSDSSAIAGQAPFAGTVTKVEYIPLNSMTGATPNNRTLSLVNKGQSGTGTTVVASVTFAAGTNAAANDELALTLAAAPSDVVAAGDTLLWRSVHNGSGLSDPGGLARIVFTEA